MAPEPEKTTSQAGDTPAGNSATDPSAAPEGGEAGQPAESGSEKDPATDETADAIGGSVPAPEDDYRDLQELDWQAATLKRFRLGKHPDPKIEALLKRRLDLDAGDFLTFYPIRLLCSLAIVVAGCGTAWVVLWGIFSLAGFHVFLRELSWGMSFLLICLMAFVITNPIRLYDEIEIEKAGKQRLDEFRRDLTGEESSSGA